MNLKNRYNITCKGNKKEQSNLFTSIANKVNYNLRKLGRYASFHNYFKFGMGRRRRQRGRFRGSREGGAWAGQYNQRSMLNLAQGEKGAKVKVDRNKCIGCSLCVRLCPTVFALDGERKSKVIKQPEEGECDVSAVAASCPVGAITIEK